MASAGYAWGHLWHNESSRFHLFTAGHSANYASPGTFLSTEQLPAEADSEGFFRDYLWTYLAGAIDACVPSLVLPVQISMWALVFEHWEAPGTVWVARGAPRRWYEGVGLTVSRAPTGIGYLTFSAAAAEGEEAGSTTVVSVKLEPPPYPLPGTAAGNATLVIKARGGKVGCSLYNATLVCTQGAADVVSVDDGSEEVVVAVHRATGAAFTLLASFRC